MFHIIDALDKKVFDIIDARCSHEVQGQYVSFSMFFPALFVIFDVKL